MHLRAVRCAVLLAAGPLATQRVVVEARYACPGGAAILGAKQPLRRRACIPHALLAHMSRSQPEDMIDHEAFLPLRNLGERRRRRSFLPALAEIGGPEDSGTKVAGARRREQRLPISRVEHEMVHDVAEKDRCRQLPGSAGPIASQEKGALRVPMSRTTELVAGLSVGMTSSFLSDLVWPVM